MVRSKSISIDLARPDFRAIPSQEYNLPTNYQFSIKITGSLDIIFRGQNYKLDLLYKSVPCYYMYTQKIQSPNLTFRIPGKLVSKILQDSLASNCMQQVPVLSGETYLLILVH